MKNFVQSARFDTSASAHRTHYHDCHQILYVTCGSAEACVGGENYLLTPGTLLIISRLEQHSVMPLCEDYQRYLLRVTPDIGELSLEESRYFSVLMERPDNFRHAIAVGDFDSSFRRLFRGICEEKQREDAFASEIADRYFLILLMKLYECAPSLFSTDSGEYTAVIRKVRDRLARDYRQQFSLSALSNEYHISSYYLSHLFRSVTGYPVMQYLQSCRIAAAKRLLTKTDMKIAEIVEETGFTDASNFCRIFKQTSGLTPSAFRDAYK